MVPLPYSLHRCEVVRCGWFRPCPSRGKRSYNTGDEVLCPPKHAAELVAQGYVIDHGELTEAERADRLHDYHVIGRAAKNKHLTMRLPEEITVGEIMARGAYSVFEKHKYSIDPAHYATPADYYEAIGYDRLTAEEKGAKDCADELYWQGEAD